MTASVTARISGTAVPPIPVTLPTVAPAIPESRGSTTAAERESSKRSSVASSHRDSIASSAEGMPAAASVPVAVPVAVAGVPANPTRTLRESITSVFSKLFNAIKSTPGAFVGYVRSFFSYIANFFSRSATVQPPAATRGLGSAALDQDAIKAQIVAKLSKEDGDRLAALKESDAGHYQRVMDIAVARYNQVMGAKKCLGKTLTDENRSGIAINEAAKTVTARV